MRLESTGEPSLDEYRATVDAFLADPAHRPGQGIVHDIRHLAEAPKNAADANRAVNFIMTRATAIGAARWATVVGTAVDFGIGRMAGAKLEARLGSSLIVTRVFYDLSEAEAWARGPEGATPTREP